MLSCYCLLACIRVLFSVVLSHRYSQDIIWKAELARAELFPTYLPTVWADISQKKLGSSAIQKGIVAATGSLLVLCLLIPNVPESNAGTMVIPWNNRYQQLQAARTLVPVSFFQSPASVSW